MTDTAKRAASAPEDPVATVSARAKRLRTILAMCAVTPAVLVLLVTTVFVGVVTGLVAAAVAAVVITVAGRRMLSGPDGMILEGVPTRSLDPVVHARLINLVDGLCLVSGVSTPDVRVCEGSWPLAMVVAGNDASSTIVVSDGAVAKWDRMESEAVLAHLFFRLRSGDAALTTKVLAVVAGATRLGLGAVGRRLAAQMLDEATIHAADLAACRTTRYPPAMVSALEKVLVEGPAPADLPVPRHTAPLWFSSPDHDALGGALVPSVGAFHPSLTDRIALCKEI